MLGGGVLTRSLPRCKAVWERITFRFPSPQSFALWGSITSRSLPPCSGLVLWGKSLCNFSPLREELSLNHFPPKFGESFFKPLSRRVEVMREDTEPLPRTSKRFGGGLRRGQKELIRQREAGGGFTALHSIPSRRAGGEFVRIPRYAGGEAVGVHPQAGEELESDASNSREKRLRVTPRLKREELTLPMKIHIASI